MPIGETCSWCLQSCSQRPSRRKSSVDFRRGRRLRRGGIPPPCTYEQELETSDGRGDVFILILAMQKRLEERPALLAQVWPIDCSTDRSVEAHDRKAIEASPRWRQACRRRYTSRRTPASVLAGRAAVWSLRIALQAPAVDQLGIETPIGADPKGWQLSATEQLVDRRWMHAQILGQFLDRHHARQAVLGFISHHSPRNLSLVCFPVLE